MIRLRRAIDQMPPWQRATLGILAMLVMAVTGLVLVVTLTRGDDAPTAAEPSTTRAPDSTVAPTTTTTTEATSTTSPPLSTTTAAVTTTTRVDPILLLRPDGVDDLDFGDAADAVLTVFETRLGEPDSDTGWVDQMENYGVCLGDEVRFVRWGSFQAFFTDGPSEWAPAGVRHFASYTQAAVFDGEVVEMVTEEGLSLGSPVGDVRVIHGEGSVYDDDLYGPVFVHDPPGPAQLWGSVSGLAPDDVIESITGSFACGE